MYALCANPPINQLMGAHSQSRTASSHYVCSHCTGTFDDLPYRTGRMRQLTVQLSGALEPQIAHAEGIFQTLSGGGGEEEEEEALQALGLAQDHKQFLENEASEHDEAVKHIITRRNTLLDELVSLPGPLTDQAHTETREQLHRLEERLRAVDGILLDHRNPHAEMLVLCRKVHGLIERGEATLARRSGRQVL